MKHIHCFQHVPFENPGSIEYWVQDRGYTLTTTRFFDGDTPPPIEEIDWLIVMGGPMGAEQYEDYPWLLEEKRAIEQAVAAGKVVLGICLGAQLIALALGASVRPNAFKEIGWFPVYLQSRTLDHPVACLFPPQWDALHWHGDTFDIPDGARLLAFTQACRNQMFVYGDRVLGLQFHLEVTRQGADDLVRHCSDELKPTDFVTPAEDILSDSAPFEASHQLMARLLDHLDHI